MAGRLNPARLVCDNYHLLREAVPWTDLVCIGTRDFVAQDVAEGRLRELRTDGFPPPENHVLAKLRGRVASPLAVAARVKAHHEFADGR